LNARNVPLDPMDDVDASYEFLESYTEALILSAYEEGKEDFKSVATTIPTKQESAMNALLDNIVDKFALPKIESNWNIDDAKYHFPNCDKKYTRISSLRKHLKDKHSVTQQQEQAVPQNNSDTTDSVFNYSTSALCLGLLALDFNNARKLGDGDRIVKLYKYLFLLFKVENRTKYTFYSFQLLCQVFYLLPDRLAFSLIHNRFVNNKGEFDSNVEVDREVEHWNKVFKKDCKEFNGKVTDNSIERASTSYDAVQQALSRFDHATQTQKPSGKHTRRNVQEDVIALTEQMKSRKLFKLNPKGRKHDAYPCFPKTLFNRIEAPKLKEWMQKQIKHFREMNIYEEISKA